MIFKKKLFEVFSYVVVKSLGKLILSETENYLDRQELLQTWKKKSNLYTLLDTPKFMFNSIISSPSDANNLSQQLKKPHNSKGFQRILEIF